MSTTQNQSLHVLTHSPNQRDWTAAQWTATIGAARRGLRTILRDLLTLMTSDINSAFIHSLRTYLVARPTPAKVGEIRTDLQVLIQRKGSELLSRFLLMNLPELLDILDTEWHYNDTILGSEAECYRSRCYQMGQRHGTHIFFYQTVGTNVIASADYYSRTITINTGYFLDKHPSTDVLMGLSPSLHAGDALDILYKTLTPVLLHECLHLARDDIKDVWILASDLSKWLGESANTHCDANSYATFYNEYQCRMLTRLAHEQFPHARSRRRLDRPYLPHEITFSNADSITRVLCGTWLSSQRQDLNFFSNAIPSRPEITTRTGQS